MVGFKFLVDIEIVQCCLKEANKCLGLKYTSICTKESETKREKSRCEISIFCSMFQMKKIFLNIAKMSFLLYVSTGTRLFPFNYVTNCDRHGIAARCDKVGRGQTSARHPDVGLTTFKRFLDTIG